MESTPRPALRLIPTGLLTPAGVARRGRVAAGCAVLIVLVHLLLAQVTLVVAVALTIIGRVGRWRRWWLAVPAAVGLCWALAIGLGAAGAGFAAGPAHLLGSLGRGDGVARLARGRPPGPFAGAGGWLPGQLPLALVAGAAEAALIGWLSRLRARSPAPPPRPGLVAAARTRLAAAVIRGGAVVTRQGCALGVDPGTGAVAEVRWPEVAGGLLVAGDAGNEVTVTCLQVAHAALRRRKPLIVIDVSDDAAISRALAAACAATGTRLRQRAADADLYPVIIERSAALVRAGSPDSAAAACAGVTALAADLRRAAVDGDALVWVTGGERLPASAVGALVADGRAAGLGVLIGTTSAAAVPELAGLVGVVVAHRIADQSLAARLAGTAGLASDPEAVPPVPGRAGFPSGLDAVGSAPGNSPFSPDPTTMAPGPRRALFAAVGPGALLALGPGEVALAVRGPAGRVIVPVRRVPAQLPRAAVARRPREWRGLRYDPA